MTSDSKETGTNSNNSGTSHVVLVDADDQPTGTMAKLAAHQAPGFRHRAFSLFGYDNDGRLLLHRRASTKYHFGGLWTNTCCSHQYDGESTIDAARRRAIEELHLEVTDLQVVGKFEYRAEDAASGLVEHELDHVVVGRAINVPTPEPSEVEDLRWVTPEELRALMTNEPETLTPWFGLAFDVIQRSFAAAEQ